MNDDTIKKFCRNHRINVLDSNKRAHKITRMNTKFFNFDNDYNKFLTDHIVMDTEKLYTVEITESELERVAKFEEQVFNNMRQSGHYDLFNVLMEQKEKEKELRDFYPAVKKAYEHYSLMLKLAESGEL